MSDFALQNMEREAFAFSPPYPGYYLLLGSKGANVSIMQSYLNGIKNEMYPELPRLAVDGIFGPDTKTAVVAYQALAGLKADGIIGEDTWQSIIADYESLPVPPAEEYPGTPLDIGSRGVHTAVIQGKLNALSTIYTAIKKQPEDGKYGYKTRQAVKMFQRQFSLSPDGVTGKNTWEKIKNVYSDMMRGKNTSVSPAYPGYLLLTGSAGDSVLIAQSYLNKLADFHKWNIEPLNLDGIFGSATKQAVNVFQVKNGLKADGIIGPESWKKLINEFNGCI